MLFMLIAIFYPRFQDYSVIGIGLWVLTAVAAIGTMQRFFFAKKILSK
jgi:hypothetical protein